jgi:tRNA (guanine-N7-)-methyltransferase
MQDAADKSRQHRTVRSFVRRAGRMTTAQKRAWQSLWPMYGIDYLPAQLDLNEVFGRKAPRVMEIGFGNGELLLSMAAESPDKDFIGVEVHEPGVGHCLLAIQNQNLSNVRVICHDAVEVLKHRIPDGSLQAVHLFFPDPWPKKRHHKRRIVQSDFVELLNHKIEIAGLLHTATDWDEYAEHMEATIAANKHFQTVGAAAGQRPQTKFEQRGKRLGHQITERFYQRT